MISTVHPDLFERFKDFETLSDTTISTTNRLVDKLYTTAKSNNLWWYPPLVNWHYEWDNSDKGQIHLEWWNKKRKYSIYVAEDQISYIAVWGADMDNEMEEGDINIENNLADFWEWIAD
jgi:hypothetical protein